MTLGAQPKKIAILGVLLAVAAVALYMNVFAGDSTSPASAPRAAAPSPVAVPVNVSPQRAAPVPNSRRANRNNSSAEIKFRQGVERPEDRPDPATIDPTLRLDLLAKVQNVEPEVSMRNLFQYGIAPPQPSAAKVLALPAHPPTIPIAKPQPPPPPRPTGPPPPPAAPLMTFKYYGYRISKADGSKEAFLLDGDDIIIAGENEALKRGRYKIVNIGLTSVTIEDTQFRSTQTLRIQEDPLG